MTPRLSDFAAIDFETANRHGSSICSIGIIIVRDGSITDMIYEMVRPYPDFYSHYNTAVHGLSADDTAAAPTFPEVWAKISPRIEGLSLVAHFSRFDEGCLRAAYLHYGMEWPGYRFHCTCTAARRTFPQLPDHKLPTVAAHCGFDLTQHHHALADAEACAHIAMKIL